MGVSEKEVDFPRGGAPTVRTPHAAKSASSKVVKSHNDENQLFGVTKKRKSKSRAPSSSETPTKKKKSEEKSAVWSKPMTLDLLTDGVMGLGVVIEIHEDYVLLETADSCRVKLPATQISKKFTEYLKLEKISLDSAFVIGQMVPFRVTERSSQTTKKKGKGKKTTSALPFVTCDPSKLYSHFSPARLVPGLVLQGIVESIEEKGALLDIGMQSLQAFLPTKNQQRSVIIGQPVMVRIELVKSSRVIAVTSYVEQDNLCLEACQSLQLNHLTPGTIIDCEPDAEPSITAGVYVNLGNGVRGFVAKSHLPPRLRGDITKIGRALRCVVMFCQQEHSPSCAIRTSRHYCCKQTRKAFFIPGTFKELYPGYSVGDRLKCTVIDVVPSTYLVCFSLPTGEDGKVPLVSAISYKKYLNKPEEIEKIYTLGSEHTCRVMNFRYADRCIVVSTRKDMLSQKFVSYKDAVLGQVVEAEVTEVHPRGVQVTLNGFVKGFIPAEHASDKKVALEKVFTVELKPNRSANEVGERRDMRQRDLEGKSIKCRVWFVNEEKKQVWLTARPSLVNYKGAVITKYETKNEGVVSVGIVLKVLGTGGVVLQFFGTARGLLVASEAKRMGSEIRVGQALEVRVTSVNVAESKMTLALADESAGCAEHILNPKAIEFSVGESVLTAIIDDVTESTVNGHRSERAILHLDSNPSVKGSLVSNLVSDSLNPPFESMKTTFRAGLKLSPVVPLGFLGGVNRFTTKRFVCEWLKTFGENVPKSFNDLKQGQLICGLISQRVPDSCLYVELAGGSGLIGKVAFSDIDGGKDGATGLQIGQTVLVRISKINREKKTFRVSLKLADCVPDQNLPTKAASPFSSVALQLLRSSVEELIALAEISKTKLPSLGSAVAATVSQIVDDVLFVTFGGKLTGCVRKGNYSGDVKVGDKIKCLIIDYVFPRNDAELVMIDSEASMSSKKKKSSKERSAKGSASSDRIVLVKRDYVVVLHRTEHLVFVPTRFHPNQIVEIKNGPSSFLFSFFFHSFLSMIIGTLRVSFGDEVQITNTIQLTNTVYIGFLEGDEKLIEKLISASKSASKAGRSSDENVSEGDEHPRKSKSELGIRTRSVKNLKTYTGTVMGEWTSDDRRDHGKLAALVQLPGGNIGRLHVSELPARFLMGSSSPLEDFIKRNRNKAVVVKVIRFTPIKRGDSKVRVAELTMDESKMGKARKQASLVAFQNDFNASHYFHYLHFFHPGDVVRCFVIPNQEMTSKNIRVEVNPIWSGQIAHEAVGDDMKVSAPQHDGEVFECIPKGGEMRMAKVLSAVKIKKGHGHGLLNLAFDLQADVKVKVRTRSSVDCSRDACKASPDVCAVFIWPTDNWRRCVRLRSRIITRKCINISKHFNVTGIFHLYALRQEQNPQRNYVCAEGRYESYLRNKDVPAKKDDHRRLLVDRSEVAAGYVCDGFVAKHTTDALLVEIGPGIIGRLRKIHHPEVSTITLNSIVTVRVRHVDNEGRISLSLVAVVFKAPAIQDRKRAAEEDDSVVPKKEKKKESSPEPVEKVSLSDPGFDWTNTGFRPEDLAAVGKLGSDDEDDDKPAADKASPEEVQKPPVEVKKERVKEIKKVKAMTKEEQDMEKERRLTNREVELSGDFEPETQEDFARLLRKDPNSAEIWIRYISFFLEKNDLTKARATAERALTVINYREEAEIFNIWTAFLNMEVAYGDETSTKEVFSRACGNADAYKIHKQMAAIYSDTGKNQEADEIYDAMVKKFRANSDDVWTLYGEHLMKTDRADAARELMKRALASVPKQRHVPLISRFAQMEFRNGDVEKGRTLFESLVRVY
ncbi:S1 RNA binding domain protein [Cooperia oncophora]